MTSMWRTGDRNNECGFSLLELLVVLALLAALVAVAVVQLPDISDRLVLSRATNQMLGELSAISIEALRTGRSHSVVFDGSGLRVRGRAVPLDDRIQIRWIAAAEAGSTRERGVISFFGTGGATGGTLELISGTARANVTVDWLTGSVRQESIVP